jgi:hypothetical protein
LQWFHILDDPCLNLGFLTLSFLHQHFSAKQSFLSVLSLSLSEFWVTNGLYFHFDALESIYCSIWCSKWSSRLAAMSFWHDPISLLPLLCFLAQGHCASHFALRASHFLFLESGRKQDLGLCLLFMVTMTVLVGLGLNAGLHTWDFYQWLE